MATFAFTGGGTGGHIYPGLAVIERLKARLEGGRIIWIGSNTGMDRAIAQGAGLEFFGIPAGKLRRYFSLRTIPDTFRVAAGFFAARSILYNQKVDFLFSKGGFVSVPPCAAAASLGIPVFTHESDVTPGLATRINLRFVRRTGGTAFVSYPDTARLAPGALVSGNPVRPEFRAADPERGRSFLGIGPQRRILLVLGGSQGAREVNELVRASLGELLSRYAVVHQYGPGQQWDPPAAEGYIPLPYINEEMPHVLAAAELVAGRSGAGTVWECAVAGKPMILIPLRGSGTRGDQLENARYFEREGAALVPDGNGWEGFAALVCAIADDPSRREAMAEAARRIGSLDGAAIIVDSIMGILDGRSRR